MDSYARQILLGFLDADLDACEYPWSAPWTTRTRSLWQNYARAVKDATGHWPELARWEPTTERIPCRNPLMAGMFWEILAGEAAPRYPYDAREQAAIMLAYVRNRYPGPTGKPPRGRQVPGWRAADFDINRLDEPIGGPGR